MQLDNIYLQHKNVVVRDIVGETLLVPISGELADMERIFTFTSPVGRLTWDCLDGKTDLDAILSKVLEKYEVDRETAEEDLKELISDLLEASLIKKA